MKTIKKEKKKRGFLDWLVETLRTGSHIAKNPPKGPRPRDKFKTPVGRT